MNQPDAVAEVMRRHGGYATLATLFQEVPKMEGVVFTGKTPNANIRRIVQRDPRMFRIRPGLWALEKMRDNIPFLDAALAPADSSKGQEFSHGYYQGLLVEIGNMRKHRTYVPPQDKNRKYLGRPLSSVVSLDRILNFGYPHFVDRAKTIDVIWFNDREMPTSFMEVEHSTDIQNSLIKFYELQDFYVRFKIIAAANRRKDYDSKIGRQVFAGFRGRVDFVSYEDVERTHASVSNLLLLTTEL